MSTNTNIIGNTYLTLKDKFNQMEDGEVTATIIDLLSTTNEILEDAVIEECNDGTSHKTSVRNGLPKPEFRQFYQGVNCSKAHIHRLLNQRQCLRITRRLINPLRI